MSTASRLASAPLVGYFGWLLCRPSVRDRPWRAGVLVTGGDDCKVNMWALGRPQAILSLTGHQSPVDCVTFDTAEEVVVAGSSSGSIKLWDLEEAKAVRTLTGHRSNCLSLDFHPFGEFFASGSLDTNLKIWDIRRKGCIHTYKGHTKGVQVGRPPRL